MTYILYNPNAAGGCGEEYAECLALTVFEAKLIDLSRITNYRVFLAGLNAEDKIILCGGDGTLHRFANDIQGIEILQEIYYFAVGSGNDFARDLGKEKFDDPDYRIDGYLRRLPTVTVNGQTRLFLNNVGFGIDGYCCEEGDRRRAENQKRHKPRPINYTAIAIKGLLMKYKPTDAMVAVDGRLYYFSKVWLAPTMKGRFYGGGMMAAPAQDRTGETLTLMVMGGRGRLSTLMLFPSIFSGKHVGRKGVTLLSGKEITVEFDRPTPLQIDGETFLNVRSYSVTAAIPAEVKA